MIVRTTSSILAATLLAGAVAVPALAASTRTLNASAALKRTARPADNQAVQSGPITGSPFGRGTMTLRSTLKRATVTSKFTVRTARGLVNGTATARLTLDGDTATYKGTARVTMGTGTYKGIKSTQLTFTGKGPVSAKSTQIRLTGKVRY